MRGRCGFVESLKGIMLNIFIENERIHLCICIIVEQQCIIVEQQYIFIFPENVLFDLVLSMRVSNI